jgi:GGDEF domain-containing protein
MPARNGMIHNASGQRRQPIRESEQQPNNMTSSRKKKIPWLVHVYYRMRTLSFLMIFGATFLQTRGQAHGALEWAFMVFLLLVYPHLQFLRAKRASDPLATEMRSLAFDAILLGMFDVCIGFSQWIAYGATLGTITNNVINKGWRGLRESLIRLAIGIGLGTLCFGWRFTPAADASVTIIAMVFMAMYITLINNYTYIRTVQLRETREQLRQSRQDLLGANDALQRQLMRVDGMRHQARVQVNHDPQTGLYNRHYLDSTLTRELARCEREGQPLCLILVEAGHDDHSHDADDPDDPEVVPDHDLYRRLADQLNDIVRAGDVVCRYDEERFAILAPAMPLQEAVERTQALYAAAIVGIAAYPQHGASDDALIANAMSALCRAREDSTPVAVAHLDDDTHEHD